VEKYIVKNPNDSVSNVISCKSNISFLMVVSFWLIM